MIHIGEEGAFLPGFLRSHKAAMWPPGEGLRCVKKKKNATSGCGKKSKKVCGGCSVGNGCGWEGGMNRGKRAVGGWECGGRNGVQGGRRKSDQGKDKKVFVAQKKKVGGKKGTNKQEWFGNRIRVVWLG